MTIIQDRIVVSYWSVNVVTGSCPGLEHVYELREEIVFPNKQKHVLFAEKFS